MIAFDADVLSKILRGDAALAKRASHVPVVEQTILKVVVEELHRGRLNSIRQAEADKGKLTLERVYELLQETVDAFQHVPILPYTPAAEVLLQEWRNAKIRV